MSPSPRVEARLEVRNRLGLHARAAALVVQTMTKFAAEISVTREDQTVNGKSILGLMMLAAAPGTLLDIAAEGPDAEAALAALTDLFDARFHEDG